MAHPPTRVPPVFHDAEVDRKLAEWAEANWLALERPRLLTAGGSGGRLAAVYLRVLKGRRRANGLRIIKLTGPSPEAGAEPKNHLAALDVREPGTEEFTERHLVKLEETGFWQLGGSWVMIQLPAGDGIEEPRTLAETGRTASLPERVGSIVEGVLGGWNPAPSTGAGEQPPTAAQFVSEILGRRADPDSALRRWVRAHVGDAADTEPYLTFLSGGRPLPNPLALGAGAPLDEHAVWLAVRGHAHGDLHPGNIMVPEEGEGSPGDYWLIDLSRFSEDALLARDPAHLLVCLVADLYLPHLGHEAREELLTALVDREPRCEGPLIPQGLADTVTRLRTVWDTWGAHEQLRINPSWRPQWFLALQACALAVTARERYGDADRWWFFRLAAEAGGAYLDAMKVRRPGTAPLVTPPHDVPAPSHGVPAAAVVAVPPEVPPSAASLPPQTLSAPPQTLSVPPQAPSAPPQAATAPGGGQVLPAASGPGAPARAAGQAPEVRRVLHDIWDTFEPLRLALPRSQPSALGMLAVHVREHASRFVLALAGLPPQDSGPLEAEIDRIVALVRDVESKAAALLPGIPAGRVGPYDDRGSRRPAPYEALAAALDALLVAVGRARSVPGATPS